MEERVIVCRSFDLCEDYVNFIVIIEYDEPHSKAQILRPGRDEPLWNEIMNKEAGSSSLLLKITTRAIMDTFWMLQC